VPNATAVCVIRDATSKELFDGFINKDGLELGSSPTQLSAVSEDGERFGIALTESSFVSHNPINGHLMLRAKVDGVPRVPIVVDMIDPDAYRLSFFRRVTSLRRRIVYDTSRVA